MPLEVGNCFLKIGRVAHPQCHILGIRTKTYRPAGNDTLSTAAMSKDHADRQDIYEGYDLSRYVGTKKLSTVLRPGALMSGSLSASKRCPGWWLIQTDRGRRRKVAQTRSGSGQMVLRSTIPYVNNRAKTEMSGEAVTHV